MPFRAAITMGYFEVDGRMRDPQGLPEPYLWFEVTCEGLGEFKLKRCLKCPGDWSWSVTDEVGFNIVIRGKEKNDYVCNECKPE